MLTGIFNVGFNEVNIFYSSVSGWKGYVSAIISLFAFLSGYLLLFFLPGFLIVQNFKPIKEHVINSIALSSVISIFMYIVATTAAKLAFNLVISRIDMVLIILIVLILSSILSVGSKIKKDISDYNIKTSSFFTVEPAIFLLIITLVFITFHHSQIVDGNYLSFSYNEKDVLSIPLGEQSDDLEMFGLANSLKSHILPYWDLEYADRFGYNFTDPSLYAYISMFALVIFGESFASLTLISISFIFLLFAAIVYQKKAITHVRMITCSIILLSYYLFLLDIHTQLIYPEYFFIFIIIISFFNLIDRKYNLFLIFAIIATLTKFYAIFFVILSLIAIMLFYKKRGKEIIATAVRYLLFCLGYITCIILFGYVTGNLDVYWKSFVIEHFERVDFGNNLTRLFPNLALGVSGFGHVQRFEFLKWCLLSTAFTFPILFLFGKNNNDRFFSFIGIAYFLIIFFSQYQYMRYIIPLVPITAIVLSNKMEYWFAKNDKI